MNEAAARQTARLGMAVFLASEAMLFGALIAALLMLRLKNPDAFSAGSAQLDLVLGTTNTGVLLTSSLCVALAVHGMGQGRRAAAARWLATAAALGLVFLAIKGSEYYAEFREGLMPGASGGAVGAHRLFMDAYLAATGLHALHVAVGIGLLATCALRLRRGAPLQESTVDNCALYWHLVDVVWVFLFPVLYLSR